MRRIKQLIAASLCLGLTFAPMPSAWAAIALVASSNGTVGANSAPAVTAKNWTGATLGVACVSADQSNGAGQTVTDNKGNTWTRANRQSINASQIELWYSMLTSATSGTNITYSGTFARISVAAFSATATSSVADGAATSNTGAFATTMQPGSITPSQNGDLLYSCLGIDAGGGAEAINASFSILDDSAFGGCCYGTAHAYFVQSTASAINPQWSGFSSTSAGASMQAFKDNSGGGGGATGKFIMMGTP